MYFYLQICLVYNIFTLTLHAFRMSPPKKSVLFIITRAGTLVCSSWRFLELHIQGEGSSASRTSSRGRLYPSGCFPAFCQPESPTLVSHHGQHPPPLPYLLAHVLTLHIAPRRSLAGFRFLPLSSPSSIFPSRPLCHLSESFQESSGL